jgi:murein DD-endopeptidase MepM/ murein hydrolase activator NlpD
LGLLSCGVTAVGLAPAAGHHVEAGPALLAADLPDRARLVVERPSRRDVPVHLVWPGDGLMTGWFGEPRASHSHPGIDLDGETGDEIWAAGAGTVVWAGPAPAGYGGYGTMIEIDHGSGIRTLYAHLSSISVAAGDEVAATEEIGTIGTTGSVTGSHLHFEVRINGVPVDPADRLPPKPKRVETPPAVRSRLPNFV